jgi:MYXO-CTERM domain-containing protein
LPQGHNYGVEALLWDGNVVVERGRGTVQFAPTTTVEEGEEVVVSEINLDAFRSPGDAEDAESHSEPTPGLGAGAAALALAGLAFLVRRRMT